jgi:hypothetical protein
MMISRLLFVVAVGLIAASPVHATCSVFGTQLECGLGARDVVIGTQAADEPDRATSSFRPQSFHGNARLLDDHARPAPRAGIALQDIGADPTLCRRIGNEDYCY